MMRTPPLAYMLTLRTYGTWLHGDARGSVDRAHRAYGTPMLGANGSLERAERARLRHAPVQLDAAQRRSMTETIQSLPAPQLDALCPFGAYRARSYRRRHCSEAIPGESHEHAQILDNPVHG